MSYKTNRQTHQRFRTRPFAPEGQPECVCRGECIAEGARRPIDETPCPYRGFKTLGGYCRTCYRGKLKMEAQKGLQESGYYSRCAEHGQRECLECLVNPETQYRDTLVKEMGEGVRCEYCGRTRDKCECVVGGLK